MSMTHKNRIPCNTEPSTPKYILKPTKYRQNVSVHNIKPQTRPLFLEANTMYCFLAKKIILLALLKHLKISSPQTFTSQDSTSFNHNLKIQSPLQQTDSPSIHSWQTLTFLLLVTVTLYFVSTLIH